MKEAKCKQCVRYDPISDRKHLREHKFSKKGREWVAVGFCNIWVFYKSEVLIYVIKIESKTKEK